LVENRLQFAVTQRSLAQHAVNKACRAISAEHLRQRNCLINGYIYWHAAADSELKKGDAQDIAVNDSHLFKRPLWRKILDCAINARAVVEHAIDNQAHIAAGAALRFFVFRILRVQTRFDHLLRWMISAVQFVEHLQGDAPRQAANSYRRVVFDLLDVVLAVRIEDR
jgi:hypothetical protein